MSTDITPVAVPAGITKVGPWGGDEGAPWDTGRLGTRLARIQIRYDTRIGYLRFQYELNEELQWSEEFGTDAAADWAEIVLEEGEHIGFILGHWKDLSDPSPPWTYQGVVTSLTFVSNLRKYGPYGSESGSYFCLPKFENDTIVGFHGRSGTYINALGVYLAPVPTKAGITKVGPWGGDGGASWDTGRLGTRLATIRIRFTYGGAWDTGHVDYLRFQYELNGELQWSEGFGTYALGEAAEIVLEEGEHIGFILGHTGESKNHEWEVAPTVVKSLAFVSNLRKYGPYGQYPSESGTGFCLPKSENDMMIVGFHGRSGTVIDALGVYLAPVTEGLVQSSQFENVTHQTVSKGFSSASS